MDVVTGLMYDHRSFLILLAIVVIPAFIIGLLQGIWRAREKRDGKR